MDHGGNSGSKTYLVVSIECDYQQSGDVSADFISAQSGTIFSVVPASTVWHPTCETLWPRTFGPQTAVVTGPANETIWADRYGRVKVHFRWDRYGKGMTAALAGSAYPVNGQDGNMVQCKYHE